MVISDGHICGKKVDKVVDSEDVGERVIRSGWVIDDKVGERECVCGRGRGVEGGGWGMGVREGGRGGGEGRGKGW